MKVKSKLVPALIMATFAAIAAAQQPGAAGGTVVTSEPGEAVVASAVEISAQVVGIDKAARALALKGSKGNAVDVVAGGEGGNFDQIEVGGLVVAC